MKSSVAPVAPPGPVTFLWRWRYEIAVLAGAPAIAVMAVRGWGAWWALAGGTATVLTVCLWPEARRRLAARVWCVITTHRVRKAFAEGMVVTRRGKLPVIVCTRPEAFGERLWVWCRAGISPRDVEETRELIAAACWFASEVRVWRHPQRASLVVIDVVRPRAADRDWATEV
ncbi:hypothetical protein J5X84_01065 [Streptosporangiaceae bacterium NEAU-GS5]|nr:hypothetical protein [Streptosporangiaceae bacterium NEAU-GS5]